jgi:hypothetical protein
MAALRSNKDSTPARVVVQFGFVVASVSDRRLFLQQDPALRERRYSRLNRYPRAWREWSCGLPPGAQKWDNMTETNIG